MVLKLIELSVIYAKHQVIGLRHDRRMMLRNLPLSILEEVDESVTSLNLLAINSHGEFVNSGILGPVGSYNDISIKNLSLGFELAEVGEVINNSWVIGTWNIRYSWELED